MVKTVINEAGEPSVNAMAAEAEVRAPSAIKLKVTSVIEVPHDYLKDVSGNANYLRDMLKEAAEGLMGDLVSVEIS